MELEPLAIPRLACCEVALSRPPSESDSSSETYGLPEIEDFGIMRRE